MSPLAQLRRALVYLCLSVAAFVSVFPFYWMIVGATNTATDINIGKASFGNALHDNVVNFFTQVDVPLIFYNTAKLAVFGTIFTLLVSSLAGYGIESMIRSAAKILSRIRERNISNP